VLLASASGANMKSIAVASTHDWIPSLRIAFSLTVVLYGAGTLAPVACASLTRTAASFKYSRIIRQAICGAVRWRVG
jgi:hypothetical protein